MATQGTDPQAAEAATPADIPPRTWKQILIATYKEGDDDNVPLIAAGVAFYAFLAFVPLLTAMVLSYGLVAEPSSVVSHMQTLTSVMPQSAAQIIGDQLQSMTSTSGAKTGFALILAIGIALYGASKGAGAIMTALNVAFEVKETRNFIKRTLIAFAMTAGALVVLFFAILAISAMNLIEDVLPSTGGVVHVLLQILFFGLAAASVALLLAIIYRYGPNRPEAKWVWISPGSAVATILWIVATAGFGFYVSNFGNYNATYGSLGAVIVFLTWLYLTAYIVIMGAELNSEMEARVGEATVTDEAAATQSSRAEQVGSEPAPSDKAGASRSVPPAPTAAAPGVAPPGNAALLGKRIAYALLLRVLGGGQRAGRAGGAAR